MRTVKFVATNRGQFTAALRKNVNEYFKTNGISTKGNWKMSIKIGVLLCLYIIPFILIIAMPMSNWLIFPLSLIMGIGMSGIGMGIMHDAAHGSLSNKKWLNTLLGHSMYIIGGNTFNWKIQHNILHHTFTNIEGFDEDIEPKGLFRLSKQSPLKKMHRFQHVYVFFFYCFMTLSRMVNEFRQLAKYNKSGITRQQGSSPKKELAVLIVSKAVYLFVLLGLPLLFSEYSWQLVLTSFFIMHFTAGLFMSVIFQLAHIVGEATQPVPKDGIIENEWMIHEMETTVNFSKNNSLFGWLIGGLNYQIEHHLFPNICHQHYKSISPIVEKTATEFGLKYNQNRTFFSAIGSHVRLLRTLGSSD